MGFPHRLNLLLREVLHSPWYVNDPNCTGNVNMYTTSPIRSMILNGYINFGLNFVGT